MVTAELVVDGAGNDQRGASVSAELRAAQQRERHVDRIGPTVGNED